MLPGKFTTQFMVFEVFQEREKEFHISDVMNNENGMKVNVINDMGLFLCDVII